MVKPPDSPRETKTRCVAIRLTAGVHEIGSAPTRIPRQGSSPVECDSIGQWGKHSPVIVGISGLLNQIGWLADAHLNNSTALPTHSLEIKIPHYSI